jgi:putative transposase
MNKTINFELSDMKNTRFTESQIIKALKENEQGRKVEDICRELGVHKGTFYNWRKKYSGMDASQLKELKELKEENRRLKQMYADLSLDNAMLKDVLSKKF